MVVRIQLGAAHAHHNAVVEATVDMLVQSGQICCAVVFALAAVNRAVAVRSCRRMDLWKTHMVLWQGAMMLRN
jgi:hypothetical protein